MIYPYFLRSIYQSFLKVVSNIVFCSHQAKERQKKKGGTKGIRVDADGGVFLEDFADNANGFESTADPDKAKPSKKVNIFPIYFEWNMILILV